MEGKRVAVVVSHPAHLLTVLGMLLRCRPAILILNRTVAGQDEMVRLALRDIDLEEGTTTLGTSEPESYACALAGDHGFHLALGRRIRDWLFRVRPEVVLGDAFEAYSFQHDVGRALLDDAVRRYRQAGHALEN